MSPRREALHSKERAKRKKERLVGTLLLLGFVVVGLGALLFSVPRYPQITIDSIQIEGTDAVSKEGVLALVEGKISGTYAYFFPRKSIFLYPKAAVASAVLAYDPHIKQVDVSFDTFRSIKVSVKERKPFALYCGEAVASSTLCFFLDETGFIFATAPEFSGSAFIEYKDETTSSVHALGTRLVSLELFKGLSYVTDRLAKEGQKPLRVTLGVDERITVLLENDVKLYFKKTEDFARALDNFAALLLSSNFKGKGSDGKLLPGYVDLRFGNKLFYKIEK